jgi:hypothetical protein
VKAFYLASLTDLLTLFFCSLFLLSNIWARKNPKQITMFNKGINKRYLVNYFFKEAKKFEFLGPNENYIVP